MFNDLVGLVSNHDDVKVWRQDMVGTGCCSVGEDADHRYK